MNLGDKPTSEKSSNGPLILVSNISAMILSDHLCPEKSLGSAAPQVVINTAAKSINLLAVLGATNYNLQI